jgi:hypothetical protein
LIDKNDRFDVMVGWLGILLVGVGGECGICYLMDVNDGLKVWGCGDRFLLAEFMWLVNF